MAQQLYSFFSRSVICNVLVKMQTEHELSAKAFEVKKDWQTDIGPASILLLLAIKKTSPAACATLTYVSDQSKARRAKKVQ